MSWNVNPQSVSFTQWVADIKAYVQSKPDYTAWKDFYNSSAGVTLIEVMAGLGVYLQHKAIIGRRETYLPYCEFKSSAIARAEAGGYSCDRGQNVHMTLTILPNPLGVPISLSKFTSIGTVKDTDIYILDTVILTPGVPVIVPITIGSLLYEDVTVDSSDLQIFRFSDPKVTEDIQLSKGLYLTPNDPTTFSGILLNTSQHIRDLLNNYYVTISNTLDSVDAMYLNDPSRSSDPYYYNTNDILRLEYIEAYDLDFAFTDLNIDATYGTIIGAVYDGTTFWSSATSYDETNYVSSSLLVPRVLDRFFNVPVGDSVASSNAIGEPYWNVTLAGYTADIAIATPAFWSATLAGLAVGDIIMPTAAKFTGFYYKCIAITTGITAGAEPVWPTTIGFVNSVVDGGVTWACFNAMDYDPLTLTPISFDLTYQPLFFYIDGDIVVPTTQNGFYYICDNAVVGVASPAEPAVWGTGIPGTTADAGGVISWINAKNCRWVANDSSPTAFVKDNVFIDVEPISAIKVNAPLYYESQNLVRGRSDFMKIFKGLDSRISDTNYQDITPAVVELTYVRSDSTLGVNQVFNTIQKQNFINDLYTCEALGVPNPVISDPGQVVLYLNHNVYMKYAGSFPVVNDIDGESGIMSQYNLLLNRQIDIFDIERQIEDLVYNNIEYVRKCAITIDAPAWQANTAYVRGQFVTPVTAPVTNGRYIYECVFAGTSDNIEPAVLGGNPWNAVISQYNTDDVPLAPPPASDTLDGSVIWRCRQQLDGSTVGSTSTVNFLTQLAWNEYNIIVNTITIVPAV